MPILRDRVVSCRIKGIDSLAILTQRCFFILRQDNGSISQTIVLRKICPNTPMLTTLSLSSGNSIIVFARGSKLCCLATARKTQKLYECELRDYNQSIKRIIEEKQQLVITTITNGEKEQTYYLNSAQILRIISNLLSE
jgi:hypothetical protein